MRKFKAGSFCFDEKTDYYTDDFIKFYKKDDKELTNKELEDWAVWMNSPCSQVYESYKITCNCKDAYTEMDKMEPVWKCEYSVIGFEGIFTSVYGYGFTEIVALEDCINHFKELQNRYNIKNEKI